MHVFFVRSQLKSTDKLITFKSVGRLTVI